MDKTNFCTLTFYPATLLEVFMISKSFLVESLVSFIQKIISSANRDGLFPSFPVWVPFVSYYLLPPVLFLWQ
jgi:hypothetical protein